MNRFFSIIVVLLCFSTLSFAQMWNGVDSLFGNEWIQYEQQYFKMLVAEDGVYRVNKETLEDAGVPLSSVSGAQLRVYHLGVEIPLFTSNNGVFSNQDYIEFYGKKNRGELDYHIFGNPEADMMNPRYSLYTDTSAYFLTWDTGNSNSQFVETNNNLTNLPPKETAYLEELKLDFFNKHSKEYGSQNVKNSYFETAEGFGSANLVSQSFTLNPTAPASGNANLYIRYATDYGGGDEASNGIHKQFIRINGNVVQEDNNTRFLVYEHDISVDNADLTNPIEVSFEGTHSNKDKQSVANLHLTYPRLFDFEGGDWKYFTIGSSAGVKYLEIENFNINGETVLYDLTNRLSITPVEENGILRIALPPSATERALILVNRNTGVEVIDAVESVTFIDYQETEADYFIVSHPILMQPDNQGINRVGEYADYRASVAGGDFTPMVIDINQLYDQYAYGVARHPISIRNFANKLRKIGNLPEYFFLIGKAREYQSYRTTAQINNPDDLPLLVPTFGWPASDRMLLSDNFRATPLTAIGRLPASTTEDIRIYLNKVREFEGNVNNASTLADREWMKRIIHLGGGGNLGEQTTIRNHLVAMENVITNNFFGAKVFPFYRNNTDAVEVSTNDAIFETLNEGISMITFFGHAGANSFGYDIDKIEKFDNQGKYPFMFALGCSVGNIHVPYKAIGERFVFGNENKGMIGFVASSSFGFIDVLRVQMEKTYRLIGEEMYGESIGNIMREVTRNFDTGGNILTQQNTLNGDPALKLYPFESPDIIVDQSTVKFNPANINAEMSEFGFSFDIVNIGKGLEDSINLRIQQQLPNGQIETSLISRIKTPKNRSNVSFGVPGYGKLSVGLNRMLVTLDIDNEVEELPAPEAEINNELKSSSGIKGTPFFIQDNGIQTTYPKEFAIVNDMDLTLIASTANSLANERKYIMEFDTTENFNSPLLQRKESIQFGGLFKWKPIMDWQNKQVYYWRVSPDSTSAEESFVWDESSFIYLPNSETGWNQSDFGQWEKNELEGVRIPDTNQEFLYETFFNDIVVKNKIYDSQNPPTFAGNGQNFNSPWTWLTQQGVEMVVMDSLDVFDFWRPTENGQFGTLSGTSHKNWTFNTNTIEDRENIINFIENEIPDKHYVVFFSLQRLETSDYMPEIWAADSIQLGKNLFSVLESYGATKVRMLEEKGSVPYVFMFRKSEGALQETIANSIDGIAIAEHSYPQFITEGEIRTKLIGPAEEWKNFYWDIKDTSVPANDSLVVSIFGVKHNQITDTLLYENVTLKDFPLSQIDAESFPYLKLKFYVHDDDNRTFAQLDYWRITYQGVTELAVNPNAEYEFYRDTLQEGELFKMKYAIENISDYNADSLLIRYSVTDIQNNVLTNFERIAPLERLGQTSTEFNLNTKGLNDIQKVLVEVNPENDQMEQTHVNNFINSEFFVERDKRNPVLDVTFDGIHIMDGDLISPEPIIVINLKDENKFLELADTSLFELLIHYPEENEARRISFDEEAVVFIPAVLHEQGQNNEARIEYSPTFLVDGIYTLIVSARDATGNDSGDLRYTINFEVINKNMISSILNYPNPFSTSTRFVYTLTGNEPPAFFKIQIMTVSGRIIREITQSEIGQLRTGTHMTDYAWDGTDEFGDKLANGVYLYRVTAQKSDGTPFESIETGADQFVKKGFGKMVLVR